MRYEDTDSHYYALHSTAWDEANSTYEGILFNLIVTQLHNGLHYLPFTKNALTKLRWYHHEVALAKIYRIFPTQNVQLQCLMFLITVGTEVGGLRGLLKVAEKARSDNFC